MSYTTKHYDIAHLINIEITKYPGTRSKDIELIIGGEGRKVTKEDIRKMVQRLEEVRKDLKI